MHDLLDIAYIPESLRLRSVAAPSIVLYDLDGVIVDSSRRWKSVFGDGGLDCDPMEASRKVRLWGDSHVGDSLIPAGVQIVDALCRVLGAIPVGLTSRTECYLGSALALMADISSGVPWMSGGGVRRFDPGNAVICRKNPPSWESEEDIRKYVTSSSAGFKMAVVEELRRRGFKIAAAIDDYADVCAGYRSLGICTVHFVDPSADCHSVSNPGASASIGRKSND